MFTSRCADFSSFSDSGFVHTGNDLVYKDETRVHWNVNVHHDWKFSEDQKSIIQIEAREFGFDGDSVKADCAVKRNFDGERIAHWCLADHLQEMRQFGYFPIKGRTSFSVPQLSHLVYEISHANSLYEIPENSLGQHNEAFKRGNYIFNLYGLANGIVILSSDLKKVLKVFVLNSFPLSVEHGHSGQALTSGKQSYAYTTISTHDDQVTPDGMILSFGTIFRNSFEKIGPLRLDHQVIPIDRGMACRINYGDKREDRTVVFKWNPLAPNEPVKVIWESDWRFRGDGIRGWVSQLRNGNYLISDFDGFRSRIFVVDGNRNVKWELKLKGQAMYPALRARPMYNAEFLKSIGAI